MRVRLLLALLSLCVAGAFAETHFYPPPGGVADHGGLTGLTDDDHAGYVDRSEGTANPAAACTEGAIYVDTDDDVVYTCGGDGSQALLEDSGSGTRAFQFFRFRTATDSDGLLLYQSAGDIHLFPFTAGATGEANIDLRLNGIGSGVVKFCDSSDSTACVGMGVSGITTATTRTITWPDSNLNLGTDFESSTSNDFDPDRFACDSTDDNKADQDCLEGFGSSATPALTFKDSDAGDGDDSVVLDINCTATGSGVEDCDATLSAQRDGAETQALAVDASENTVEIGGTGLGAQIHLKAGADALNDDDWSGIVLNGWNCGASIAQWDAVYLDDTANEWLIADADLAGAFPARGIAIAACTDGNPGVILVQGVVRNDAWTWAANGSTLFLSDTGTGSSWTVTAPSTSGDCVQVIGFTVSDDEAYFNFSGHYLEVQ